MSERRLPANLDNPHPLAIVVNGLAYLKDQADQSMQSSVDLPDLQPTLDRTDGALIRSKSANESPA